MLRLLLNRVDEVRRRVADGRGQDFFGLRVVGAGHTPQGRPHQVLAQSSQHEVAEQGVAAGRLHRRKPLAVGPPGLVDFSEPLVGQGENQVLVRRPGWGAGGRLAE